MQAFVEIPVLPPRSIVLHPPLSDEEFENLCQRTEFVQLERTKEGTIRVNVPAGGTTGEGNSEIIMQLRAWWKHHRRGRVYDSNTGFFLPDGSMLSPDAAYLTPRQLAGLSQAELSRFIRRAPAFVVELCSPSDRLAIAAEKMQSWITNGVEVGWLVDPEERQIHIYEPGAPPRIESSVQVAGSGPVSGFILDATEVWRCYE
ncbi:MAG TPA: Uma2 family endonuclease [Terracidiphilus sp.]